MATTLQFIYNRYNIENIRQKKNPNVFAILHITRVLCRRATKEQERLSSSLSVSLTNYMYMANLYFAIQSPFI